MKGWSPVPSWGYAPDGKRAGVKVVWESEGSTHKDPSTPFPHSHVFLPFQALDGFKTGKFNTLVATDVAARGLDIDSVELVVMLDAPADWETYIHRSGRTGRAGKVWRRGGGDGG